MAYAFEMDVWSPIKPEIYVKDGGSVSISKRIEDGEIVWKMYSNDDINFFYLFPYDSANLVVNVEITKIRMINENLKNLSEGNGNNGTFQSLTHLTRFETVGDNTFQNVENFANAFGNNHELEYIGVIDTSSATDMHQTFSNCFKLSKFSNDFFNIPNVTDIHECFNNLWSLLYFPELRNFNSGDINFERCFQACISLKIINNIDTSNSSQTSNMFRRCDVLIRPDSNEQSDIENGENWSSGETFPKDVIEFTSNNDFINITVDSGGELYTPIDGRLTTLNYDERNPITGKRNELKSKTLAVSIVDPTEHFTVDSESNIISCEILKNHSITSLENTFAYCDKLEKIGGVGFENITNVDGAFFACHSLNDIEPEILNCEKYTSLNNTFGHCQSIKEIELTNMTDNLTDLTETFKYCTSLKRLVNFDTSTIEKFDSLFEGCSSLKCLEKIDTRNETSTVDMFKNTPMLCKPNSKDMDSIETGTNWFNPYTVSEDCCQTIFLGDRPVDNLFFNGLKIQKSFLDQTPLLQTKLENRLVMEVRYESGKIPKFISDCSLTYEKTGEAGSLDIYLITSNEVASFLKLDESNDENKGLFSVLLMELNDVVSLEEAFRGCETLTNFYIYTKGKTNSLTNINNLFDGCTSLSKAEFKNLNFDNITTANGTFKGCNSLKCIDAFDTSINNVDISTTFANAPKLKHPSVENRKLLSNGYNWVNRLNCDDDYTFKMYIENSDEPGFTVEGGSVTVEDVTDKIGSVYTIDSNVWLITSTDDITSLIISDNAREIITIIVEQCDTLEHMIFSTDHNDSEILTLAFKQDASTTSFTSFKQMFKYCSRENHGVLRGLENLDTSNVVDMEECFSESNFRYINIKNWDVSNVTNFKRMFYYPKFVYINNRDWIWGNKTKDMTEMFAYAGRIDYLGSLDTHGANGQKTDIFKYIDDDDWVEPTASKRDDLLNGEVYYRSNNDELFEY